MEDLYRQPGCSRGFWIALICSLVLLALTTYFLLGLTIRHNVVIGAISGV